ncbi:hypothetical protein ACH95_13265 [Bacillus glycinifermentans]|uniref:hypothetical protein n=1 Tax=Bacillus glycinifermentans TaxID=1664069 RepID=UPI000654003C|nr:hypothetical protein [Bacillus glycinifermentans]KMM58590.1 hypothetical protein ACH95_13265 [Bacillus glycinifermentans]MEC0494534.1 hypothetical protein [Bacillus glycinifermentans]MEC0541322.1 hypothetical protein [Bacillus glycinifermentans]MEC3608876.1 hypothetical protein [Bacillus glycinifermentans]UOY89709.1 hypothetical protein MW696_05620 [Bacillus glycinifermentans]
MKKAILGLSLSAVLLVPSSFAAASESVQLTNEQKALLEAKTEYVRSLPEQMNIQSGLSAYSGKRLTIKRGSFLAWSKDYIEWYYNGKKISSSNGSQDVGYVFPNIVKAKGINRYYKSSGLHKWRAKKTHSIGTVTPWGDVVLTSTSFTDRRWVNKKGKYGND